MEVNPKTGQSLRDAIIDLYLNVKIRSNEEVIPIYPQIAKFDQVKYDSERSHLIDVSPFTILDYIRSSVEILMNSKDDTISSVNEPSLDSQKDRFCVDASKGYDQMLRKLEEESREHIQIEQQLKLYIDSIEEQNDKSEKKIKELNKNLNMRVQEIDLLKENLKELNKKYDETKTQLENIRKTTEKSESTTRSEKPNNEIHKGKYIITKVLKIIMQNNKDSEVKRNKSSTNELAYQSGNLENVFKLDCTTIKKPYKKSVYEFL